MKLENKETINRPLEEVYNLVKNDLEKIVSYLPNVSKIETKESNDNIRVNHWYAVAEMPKLVSKFINPDIFSWKDTATWNDENHSVDYVLESFLANDLFDAKGNNTFKAIDENTTELTVSFELEIYPDKVPGVPRLLAGKVKPVIETLVEKILAPNLTSLGKGLNEYFNQ